MAGNGNPAASGKGDGAKGDDHDTNLIRSDSRSNSIERKGELSLLGAALDYAQRGLPVFPCRADTKAPMVSGGFKTATTDPEKIEGWWARWPAALIGMPTGRVSGIDVLDIDVKHDGYAAVSDWADRSPIVVKTPTGGAHLWFKSDGSIRNTASQIGPGVDTRGEGGYVIVPPSARNGALYRFEKGSVDDRASLPPFPADLVARMKPRDPDRKPSESPEAPMAVVEAALAVIPNDDLGYDDWKRVGLATWRATGGAGFEAFDQWSQKSGKYRGAITRKEWRGISRSPPDKIGFGTLSHMAGEVSPGWRDDLDRAIEKSVAHANRNALSWSELQALLNGQPSEDEPPEVEPTKADSPPTKVEEPKPATAAPAKKGVVSATPFEWIDPTTLPRRQWLYKPHYIRRFLSLTVAAGGIGKSSLVLVEALALATGKGLLGITPPERCRVWYVNLEDPMEELRRRIAAVCLHYEIAPEDIAGRLFVDSGRDANFVITSEGRYVHVDKSKVDNNFTFEIEQNQIDVLIVDPFVAAHRAPENDNTAIEDVAEAFARIADVGNCSVMLVHHARKTGGEKATVDHGRGASALNAAARTVRVLNTMTDNEAENAEIDEFERRRYFRSDVGKANLTRPAEVADWFELRSVDLENCEGVDWDQGDHVGVVVAFKYPEVDRLKPSAAQIQLALEAIRGGGPWRADQRAKKEPWVGVPIAEALGVGLEKKPDKRAMVQLVEDWLKSKLLVRVEKRDDHRQTRKYVEAAAVEEPRREEGGPNG